MSARSNALFKQELPNLVRGDLLSQLSQLVKNARIDPAQLVDKELLVWKAHPGVQVAARLRGKTFVPGDRKIGPDGQVIAEMGAGPNGNGLVVISNAEGEVIAQMGADPNGNGIVQTHNAEGEVVAMMGADPKGNGLVRILNAKGVWESP